MSKFVILLEDASGKNREISGNKAAALADMIRSCIKVLNFLLRAKPATLL